ncbi:MAG: hypothetical protein M3512_04520 [Bacteroidota bacterium]|nr:hypothetical protein [Bacteroidota bacterium]
MKKNLILAIVFVVLLILNIQAQVVSTHPSMVEIAEDSKMDAPFSYTSMKSIEDELDELSYYDSHFLGEEIAKKAQIIKNLYIKQNEVVIGFGNSHVEIQKPVIFNSLNKIESHLKKAVRKGKLSIEDASLKYSDYLKCVYVLYFEHNTEKLEAELQKAKDAGGLMEVFDSIKIEYL